MILCICNNISETDLRKNPELRALIGNSCGKCKEFIDASNSSTGQGFNSLQLHQK